jgi:hypothetical protein
MKAFATSTIASTIADGGILEVALNLNCAIEDDKFHMFARLVLGLCLSKQHGTEPSDCSFANMLLDNFVAITNLTAVFTLNEPDDCHTLALRLARFSLLLLSTKALTPKIIARVWGENEEVRHNLGGPCGDLALVCCQLISLASIASNTFHLWLTTLFNGEMIITPDTLQHLPPGMKDILNLVALNDAAIYVCEPIHSRQNCISILQDNLCQDPLNPQSSNFDDIIVGWYHRDHLLNGIYSTDSAGHENHIFTAYGLHTSSP